MLFALADGKSLDDLCAAIARDREVIAPVPAGDGQYRLERAPNWRPGRHTPAPYRFIEPLRALFFRARERVGALGEAPPQPPDREQVVFGVKNCDLLSLQIHDAVFRDSEPVDPGYTAERARTLVVSCDCSDCLEVCFCTALGHVPYPDKGFDINLSDTGDGWLAESGSPRGEEVLKACDDLLVPVKEDAPDARLDPRQAIEQKVAGQAAEHGLTPDMNFEQAIRETRHAPFWEEFAADCVECGACNHICCTCHCFLLADGQDRDGRQARIRQWDACLYRNFARVGGGANPRAQRAARLRNRFEKKFNFFPDVLDVIACDGCGRCIEACTADIDIRKVLKRAVHDCASLSADDG